MAKLKTFEQYVSEKNAAQQEVDEATVVMDAVDPKSKGLAKLLKKNNVTMEIIDMEGPSGFPEVELTGDRKDLVKVLADDKHGWDDASLAEYIEEGKITVELKEGNAFGDAVRKAKEAGETEFEFEGETYKVEESEEVAEDDDEDDDEDEDAEEETEEEVAEACSEMLEACYEACKNEAKVWEEDAHDEHTVESYMKENAALVASLSANALKEMREEYSTEAYEAACNAMVEAYTNKMNEMKEMGSAEDAENLEESIQLFLESYELIEEGWLKQALGYTLFMPLTLLNIVYQFTMKKIKIKKMLKNETDPKKKAKLKEELKGIKYEEAKAKEKVEDQKAKMKDAADASKGNASPEEKEKYKKEKAKMQKKLDKQKEKLRQAQGQYNGLV